MIDIFQIDDTIKEIERKDPLSLFDCQNLAALHCVKDKYSKKPQFDSSFSTQSINVEQELNEILPQYIHYCDIKRKYQIGELSEKYVLKAMTDVCLEIKQFINTLYSSTDMQAERDKIKQMINDLQGTFK